MRKYAPHSPKSNAVGTRPRQYSRRDYIQDTEILQLQSSVAKLSLMNSENSLKVKLVESALKSRSGMAWSLLASMAANAPSPMEPATKQLRQRLQMHVSNGTGN